MISCDFFYQIQFIPFACILFYRDCIELPLCMYTRMYIFNSNHNETRSDPRNKDKSKSLKNNVYGYPKYMYIKA